METLDGISKNICMYMETLESPYVRPYVALCFYSLKAEEEDLEPAVFTEVAARKHSTANTAKNAR